jgi:hypothetical protein
MSGATIAFDPALNRQQTGYFCMRLRLTNGLFRAGTRTARLANGFFCMQVAVDKRTFER